VCQLPFGRINALNVHRGESLNQELGERAVAAADVDPPQAPGRRQPIEKNPAGEPAPDAHHALIAGAVVEANFSH
jgi:hypothetical protein